MKMKKIAVLLSVILAVQGFIPDTALFASETASGNEAYATFIEDGGGAEAIGYEAPEVEEAETEEEDSISSDSLDADDTAAEIQWPANATTVSAGSFDTIYKYHNGKGYGFAFWLDDGLEKDLFSSTIWDYENIYYRIDGGVVQRVVHVDGDGTQVVPYYGGTRVAFNGGYLSRDITEGIHGIEVAVKRNSSWMTGSMSIRFSEGGNIEEIKRYESGTPNDIYSYFSSKDHGFIRDYYAYVNADDSTDSIASIELLKSGSERVVSNGDFTNINREVYYYDARYQYEDYMLASCFPKDNNISFEVDFELDEEIPEGWYDVVVTNTSGLKTRIQNVMYGTYQPVVYVVDTAKSWWCFDGVTMFPNISSQYVSAYVYGLNIPSDGSLLPVFYHNSKAVTRGIVDSEQNGDGWGRYFKLKKDDSSIWDSKADKLELQLGVTGSGILGNTETEDHDVNYGPVLGNIGAYLLLTDDWVSGADEIGIVGYTGNKEVFSQTCTPEKNDEGYWYIHVTKTHNGYGEYIDNTYENNTYKVYRKVNGNVEYSDADYYYLDNSSTPSIHSLIPEMEAVWTPPWSSNLWMGYYYAKENFEICPVDSMEVIASGKVTDGKSILGCIEDSSDREKVSQLPFMRVLFYDSHGILSMRCYVLGDGSEPEEDEFEEVIPVKGKIALEAPDFAVAKWKSSNKGIASVNKYGVVTGKSAGKALITAIGKGTNPYNKNYTIYVEKPVLKNATLYNWDSFNINRKVSGVSRLKPVGYDSSDPSVLSIDDSGNVTVKKGGRSKLTIYYKYGSVSAAYTVKLPCFKKGEISMLESKTRKLSVVNKNSASSIVFTSSNEEVSTVAYNGSITAISPGFTKISLLVNGEVYDVCKVTVLKPLIDQRSINLKPGKSMKLKLLNKSKNTMLVSSDNTVATVTQGGKVRGISKGTAVISTKIDGTVYDTCTVTVY